MPPATEMLPSGSAPSQLTLPPKNPTPLPLLRVVPSLRVDTLQLSQVLTTVLFLSTRNPTPNLSTTTLPWRLGPARRFSTWFYLCPFPPLPHPFEQVIDGLQHIGRVNGCNMISHPRRPIRSSKPNSNQQKTTPQHETMALQSTTQPSTCSNLARRTYDPENKKTQLAK